MQMNEGDIRIRGLEAIREWVSKDDRYINMIGECEIIRDAVSILRRRTIGDGEEGEEEEREEREEGKGKEEGVSVREKNGILGIVLEMVEGGGWKGSYSELEEVVGRLEEEGKKEWISKRREKGINSGREWKEMGRLAREIGWEIEKRKRMEGREGRGGDMITLHGMKKNLEEEKKGREAEKKRADEEQRMKEEEMKKVDEMKKGREEEKRKKEEAETKNRELENRIERMRVEMEEMKKREDQQKKRKEEEEKHSRPIRSLDGTSVVFTPNNGIKREGNTIIHHGPNRDRNCFIGGEMTSV